MSRIAVVGCGYWGRNLVRNFHQLGALEAVCDAEPATLEKIQRQYASVSAYASYEELLAAPGIDAVVIASTADQHAAMAEAALLAGKDVFVEKPLALRYGDGERV